METPFLECPKSFEPSKSRKARQLFISALIVRDF